MKLIVACVGSYFPLIQVTHVFLMTMFYSKMQSHFQNIKKHVDNAVFAFSHATQFWQILNLLLLDHTHIGCLSSFSVNCIKFVLLCSSFEKTYAKINIFCFLGPCIAIGKKRGQILGHTQNQSQPFLAKIKKQITSFQKLFIYQNIIY